MTDSGKSTPAEAGAARATDEFAHIPRSRTRHPIVGAAGALLAFFLVFHLRHDLRYALSSSDPVELGSARATFGADKVGSDYDNRYVRVAGTPDRESGLQIDTKGSWVFSQFFRVLGTGDRLFVHRRENPLPAARAEADVFEGRLIRFGELSFAEAIRAYFAKRVTATHFFPPDVFLRTLAARPGTGPLTLTDRAGDSVTLAGDEALVIDVAQPDRVRVGLPRTRFATEDDARAALTSRGGEVLISRGLVQGIAPTGPEPGPLSTSAPPPAHWVFVVRFAPARRENALNELGNLDRQVELRDARESLSLRVSDVSATANGLLVRAPGEPERPLGTAEIAAVHTTAPVVIPDSAYLLVEGDQPREHVATIFIALMLLVFGTVNLMGLIRGRLRGSAPQ